MNHKNMNPVIGWLFTGCFLIFSMVIVGGITRLTGSGLSITEWNVIMGAVPPLNHSDWNIAFDKYKQTPQFQKVNSTMSLDQFKSIFWWEFIHRFVGRLIGIVFIIPFLYFLWKKMLNHVLIKKLVIIFLLGGLQGFLGWYMVASGLVDNPHVSHYRLAMHLITAFITYGYTLWVAMDLIFSSGDNKIREASRHIPKLKTISIIIFFTVVVQIIYGAFVAGLHGGQVYNTWPKMGDEWFPTAYIFAFRPYWINFFENSIGVQFVHRYIGTLLVLLGCILLYKYIKNPIPGLKASVWFFILALSIQFTLGIITLLYAAPITLAVFHQMGGFVLFTSAVILAHRALKQNSPA